MADLQLEAGTLAQPDCWPQSPQTLYDEMFEKGHAVSDDITGILIQDAAPDPIYRGVQGWIPTSGGVPIYPGYVFLWHPTLGHWVARNPIAAEDDSRRIFVGLSTDIDTYDGGEAGIAAAASGPMWEIDIAFNGRVPIGVGTIPTSSPAASILAPTDTTDSLGGTGAYKVALTEAEGAVGSHVHPMGNGDPGTGDIGLAYSGAVVTPSYTAFGNTGGGGIGLPVTTANLITLAADDGNGVVSDGHNNMMPYYGVFFLKRTIREFYRLG